LLFINPVLRLSLPPHHTHVSSSSPSRSPSAEKIERTVQIEASTVEIEERGVKLRLTVVDTPGYGDAINSQDWWVSGCGWTCDWWR
jgi:septin family protein